MTAAQRGKLAVELRSNGVDPEQVFHAFKTDNDGTAITRSLASAWIDQLVKGEVPPRLAEFMGTSEGSAGPPPQQGSPQQETKADNDGWREALNLGQPKEAQKSIWHAGIQKLAEEPYDEAKWIEKVRGAFHSCRIDGAENQAWRFVTIAMYAPTLEVLENIENSADNANAVTTGLMQRLGDRAEAIAKASSST